MIGGLVRAVMRQARLLVSVAVLAGAANHYLGVPVSVTLGYALVGWWLWVVLRVPARMVRRRTTTRPGTGAGSGGELLRCGVRGLGCGRRGRTV